MITREHAWDFGDYIPIKFRIEPVHMTEQHWLHTLRIYYVLAGVLRIQVGPQSYQLDPDGLILVNPYALYHLQESAGMVAIFDLDLHKFDHGVLDQTNLWFECNSLAAPDAEPMFTLKSLLAQVVKFNTGGERDQTLLNLSLSYAILHHLVTYYRAQGDTAPGDSRELLLRMEKIIRHVNQHYHQSLSLKEIAETFYLSVPYLSKIFKKTFGITFSEYINNIRLMNAMRDLHNPRLSTEQLAEKHGFPSARSFHASFRQKYACTPGQYRRRHALSRQTTPEVFSGNTAFVHNHDLELLAKYLRTDDGILPTQAKLPQTIVRVPPCNLSRKGSRLKHSFRALTSIGKAKQILSAEIQQKLRQVQEEIGFRYIIFHGFLDDDMMVYGENKQGEPELNFSYIDMAFDFLLSIRLKPFVELSFMPKALASAKAHTMYYNESIISLPKCMKKWKFLIRGLLQHLCSRYGADEVALWPFALWNVPDSSENMFGLGGLDAYFDFYRETWQTVKACNPGILFGGPSCLTDTAEEGSFLRGFAERCAAYNCLPDFYQYHYYPIRIETKTLGDLSLEEPHLVYRLASNALEQSIGQVKRHIGEYPGQVDRLFITEWNTSISHRDLLVDTVYQATYIVKNILENYDAVDALCYWVLSDSIEEVRMTNELYHGGLGLFTYNGIEKASYYAFRILAKLGDSLLARGDGYFLTRSRAGWQIVLYNYHHYSELYANGELFDMTFTNRYTPFPEPTRKKIIIPLTDLDAQEYIITETILNRSSGSSLDKWIELGALPLESSDEVSYLKSISVPSIRKRKLLAANNVLTISCTLEPHEVRLIEIRSHYTSE